MIISIILLIKVINYDPITMETDQWSLGVLCFIMLSGEICCKDYDGIIPSRGSSPFLDEEEDQQRTLSNVSM